MTIYRMTGTLQSASVAGEGILPILTPFDAFTFNLTNDKSQRPAKVS